MPLVEALEKLVAVFESKGIPMRPHLRPGLTRAEVQAALSPLGLTPPEELYQLYEWHDGIERIYRPEWLFDRYEFLPLSEAVQEYHELLKYYSEVLLSINLSHCFPFAFFEGDYGTIYCDTALVKGLQHPVVNIDGSGIYEAYESIERLTQTVTECYLSGIYDDADLPLDEALYHAIRERMNPRIDYHSPGLYSYQELT